MDNLGIYGGWLTVNRFCNMRCQWCYAMGTKFFKEDDMPLDLAFRLIDLMAEIGINHVIFIGGEPSFWPGLFKAATYIKQQGMGSTLVTNGWLLGHERFRAKIETSDLDSINISVKAGNRQQYIDLTRYDGFDKVMEGIQETSSWTHIDVECSTVFSRLVLHNIEEVVKAAFDNGANFMAMQLCGPVLEKEKIDGGLMATPAQIVETMVDKYELIHQYSGGKFAFEQNLPTCIWPQQLLDTMEKRNQLFHGCHFKTRSGLLFDRWGKVLSCNHLYDYPLGQFGKDFTDLATFREFWQRPELAQFYDGMLAYPAQQCVTCPTFDLCGGGCPLNWFVYNPDQIVGREIISL